MFTAILVLLFAGQAEPLVLDRPATEKPFVGISACQDWAAEELGRIGRAVATMPKGQRPEYSVACVPIGPLREG